MSDMAESKKQVRFEIDEDEKEQKELLLKASKEAIIEASLALNNYQMKVNRLKAIVAYLINTVLAAFMSILAKYAYFDNSHLNGFDYLLIR